MAITPDTSGYFKIIIRKFYCKLWITGLQITGFFPGLLDYSLITKITKEALRDYKPVADPSTLYDQFKDHMWHSRRKSTFRRKNTKMSYLYHVYLALSYGACGASIRASVSEL